MDSNLNTPTDPTKRSSRAVPKAVIARISRYLRELETISRSGEDTVNSRRLGQLLGFTDSQVRKDLAWFGQFGRPGVGYRCVDLIANIKGILGTDRIWNAALIGCGNLGQALLGYQGFKKQGFNVVAAFDTSPSIIGIKIHNLIVSPMSELPDMSRELDIKLAILAVPAEQADEAGELLLQSGVTGILNFAPVTLAISKRINVVDVDLAMELQKLAFSIMHRP